MSVPQHNSVFPRHPVNFGFAAEQTSVSVQQNKLNLNLPDENVLYYWDHYWKANTLGEHPWKENVAEY